MLFPGCQMLRVFLICHITRYLSTPTQRRERIESLATLRDSLRRIRAPCRISLAWEGIALRMSLEVMLRRWLHQFVSACAAHK